MAAAGESALRAELARTARRLYDRGLTTALDGNLSVRLDSRSFLITPSGLDKASLRPDAMLRIDGAGRVLEGAGKPSMETPMHLAVYEERPEVRAVIHAHPPTVIAFTLTGVPLTAGCLPEAMLAFGEIAVARYEPPGSAELADAVREPVRGHDAVLLERHGALAAGRDLFEAFVRMERLEFVAQVTLRARLLGQLKPLTPVEASRILDLRERLFGRS